MNVIVDTAPTTYPVTLEEAKAHLRILSIDDDSYIESLIAAATNSAESETQRRFITQTLIGYLDEWPDCGEVLIDFPKLQSVTYLKYKDSDGNLTDLTEGVDYVVDTASEPGRVVMHPDRAIWPTIQARSVQSIQVKFVCGYGAASDVPKGIKQAILMIIAHMYEQRQDVIVGTIVAELPQASKWLLSPYVFYRLV